MLKIGPCGFQTLNLYLLLPYSGRVAQGHCSRAKVCESVETVLAEVECAASAMVHSVMNPGEHVHGALESDRVVNSAMACVGFTVIQRNWWFNSRPKRERNTSQHVGEIDNYQTLLSRVCLRGSKCPSLCSLRYAANSFRLAARIFLSAAFESVQLKSNFLYCPTAFFGPSLGACLWSSLPLCIYVDSDVRIRARRQQEDITEPCAGRHTRNPHFMI